MNLRQILLEIKSLNVYPKEKWDEYLGYFLHSEELAKYIAETSANFKSPDDASKSLIKRIQNGIGAEPQKVDTTISSKIVNTDHISKVRNEITLGIVSGAYDLLHLGHIRSMVYAKQYLGQYENPILCALILSDENIRIKKGTSRPVLNINERLDMLCNIECIDYVILLEQPNCLAVLEKTRPDYFFKARRDDAQGIVKQEMDLVESYNGTVVVLPPSPDGWSMSTTKMIDTVRRTK